MLKRNSHVNVFFYFFLKLFLPFGRLKLSGKGGASGMSIGIGSLGNGAFKQKKKKKFKSKTNKNLGNMN